MHSCSLVKLLACAFGPPFFLAILVALAGSPACSGGVESAGDVAGDEGPDLSGDPDGTEPDETGGDGDGAGLSEDLPPDAPSEEMATDAPHEEIATDVPAEELVTEGRVGDPCGAPEDCTQVPGDSPQCMTDVMGLATLPNGYCSRTCENPEDCGEGANCVSGFWGAFCIKICTAPEDCRISEGYQCAQIPVLSDPTTYCLPLF
jgi:hypothetical protein